MNDAPEQFAPPMPARREGRSLRQNLLPCARISLVKGSSALLALALAGLAAVTAVLILFRFVNPPYSALMVTQGLYGQEIDRRWVPLSAISPNLVRAVILSEDNKFCSHFGLDLGEMRAALQKADREGEDALRGASTITQQVVKNMFLWPDRSMVRKAAEIGITLPMEVLWPKSRIMEVYLNIAEWGPGIFGAEAASQYHFSKPASRLTQREAALLAVSLPNPFDRVAGKPGQGTQRLATIIERRMAAAGSTRFECAAR